MRDMREENLLAACESRGIPEYMRGGILRYVMYGCRPGSFLQAVLENDLVGAFDRADSDNAAAMRGYVMLLFNDLPSRCWGSQEKVAAWIQHHGTTKVAV